MPDMTSESTEDEFQRLKEALGDFTDGTPQHTLAESIRDHTGLPESRCQEIAELFKRFSVYK